jgi:hypothetical protein
MKISSFGSWIALSTILGCATTPGARPHDMSTAQHEAAAQGEQQTAQTHAEQYDPSATVTRERCSPRGGRARGADSIGSDVCWTSETNSTDVHRRAAEEHRRHAADHRKASAALREAEAKACIGIAADDRDMSPFEHGEDIAGVAPLNERRTSGKVSTEQPVGATVTFRAVQGMTAEWLQRVVDCHVARNASLGHNVPEMPNCPLVVKGAEARVSSTGNGFAVEIRSSDPAVAREILARAQKLVSPGVGGSGTAP